MGDADATKLYSDLMPWDPIPDHLVEAFPTVMDQGPGGPLARRLGHYLFVWNMLEQGVLAMLIKLISMKDIHDFGAFMAVAVGADVYKKAEAMVSVASLKKPNNEWLERVKRAQEQITGPLREQRNRIIHDFWSADQENIVQTAMRARLDKATGRPKILHDRPVSLEEISRHSIRVLTTAMLLHRLDDELVAARGGEQTQLVRRTPDRAHVRPHSRDQGRDK